MLRISKCAMVVAALACLEPMPLQAQLRQVTMQTMQSTEAAEAEILHQLSERRVKGLTDGTLAELAAFLRQQGIPVFLDERSLEELGLEGQSRHRSVTGPMPLRAALQLALEQLELTWMIRGHMLIITTEDAAELNLKTRVFNVSNLLPRQKFAQRGGPAVYGRDFNSLLHVITSTIEPDSWDAVGGPGAIAPIEIQGQALLAISQTDQVLLKVEGLLLNLHRASSTPLPSEKQLGPSAPSSALRSSELPISQHEARSTSPATRASQDARRPFASGGHF